MFSSAVPVLLSFHSAATVKMLHYLTHVILRGFPKGSALKLDPRFLSSDDLSRRWSGNGTFCKADRDTFNLLLSFSDWIQPLKENQLKNLLQNLGLLTGGV
ncbi:PREDICTED: uncharacterized protein LOC104808557 [Tarenaya hassleriana]|uniref:uncharacterized protein LOC104808557 n=1 Tax=Tarenaya hassleriana TaxID=28532 RepID=UPI00053C680D|nr:PREDICTED: uncharacterized protein LOC104808557 [Tarenaya hassleriana]